LLGASLIGLTVVAYLPAIHGGFIWDDDAHITKPELRSLHGLIQIWTEPGATQQYYPLLHSVFWIEHKFWDNSVVPYHLINILLHAICAFILFRILQRLKVPGAWLAAALFALHPVQVESVAWISELKNTLSGAFFLSSALLYLIFDQSRNRMVYAASLALFLSGLMCKTVIAPLPAVLLVVLWWKRGRLSWPRDVLPLLPFFGLGMTAGLFTAWVEHHFVGAQGSDFNFSILERCLIAGRDFWFYLFKLLWPEKLTFIYPRWHISQAVWWQYLFPAATLLLLAILWQVRTRWRGPLVAFLFFLGLLFPALGFVNVFPFIYSFVADHFQYLACIGPLTLVGAGITTGLDSFGREKIFLKASLGLLLLLTLGALTWRQSQQYADIETLWRATISRNPACWLPYNNLGNIRLADGKLTEASALFEKALATKSDCSDAHNNLGTVFLLRGEIDEAIVQFKKAIEEKKPGNALTHMNLGNALGRKGQLDEAIAHYRRALELRPDFPNAHNDLANVLRRKGLVHEAILHYEQGLNSDPGSIMIQSNLAWVLATSFDSSVRNGPKAVQLAEQANRLTGGDDPTILHALAAAYAEDGQFPNAVQTAQRALELADAQGITALAKSLRSEIVLYQAGSPYHESAP
jgi:tetratricopeptide (TPR) repeat protein